MNTDLLVLFLFFLEYVPIFLDDKLDEERKTLSSSKNPASKACLAFASFFANFSLDLLIKVLLIKKNTMNTSQSAFTCPKSTIKTAEQSVKSVQS